LTGSFFTSRLARPMPPACIGLSLFGHDAFRNNVFGLHI